MCRKSISAFVAFTFLFTSILPPQMVQAQVIPTAALNLPAPGTMILPTTSFTPVLIKGITLYPDNPLQFDFIVDQGDTGLEGEALKAEAMKLIKYFMASLTVPEDQMWVNLSPHEGDKIIPQQLGYTEMGRDMLAQDYILKQLTASLMYPEKELGSKFWKRVYEKVAEKFGTTDIALNSFNKVWIVPEKAVVYEHDGGAYVVESRMKVLMEEDYVAMRKGMEVDSNGMENLMEKQAQELNSIQSQIVKEIIIPEIEREVNEGQTFAQLRQVSNAMILAAWYKMNLKESLLGQVYVDKNKTRGIELEDKNVKQKIYDQYLETFKVGVYNLIKEEYDPATQEVLPRKYFSGGENLQWRSHVEVVGEESGVAPTLAQTAALPSGDETVLTVAAVDVGPNANGDPNAAIVVRPQAKTTENWQNTLDSYNGQTPARTIVDNAVQELKKLRTKASTTAQLSLVWQHLQDTSKNQALIDETEKQLAFELFRSNEKAFWDEPLPALKEKLKTVQDELKALEDLPNQIKSLEAQLVPLENKFVHKKKRDALLRQLQLLQAQWRNYAGEREQLFEKAWGYIRETYSNLGPREKFVVARQPNRPKVSEILQSNLFTDVEVLSDPADPLRVQNGERYVPEVEEIQEAMHRWGFSIQEAAEYIIARRDAIYDDPSVLTAVATFIDPTDGSTKKVMVIGLQKGVTNIERALRNKGLARPWGYWKAIRAMRQAEKLGIPVVSLIDTPGADNSLASETNDQSGAVSYGIQVQQELKVPMIGFIIGEAGSAGSMVASQGGELYMLENAIRFVAVPEGSFNIMKGDEKLRDIAAKRGLTSPDDLKKLKAEFLSVWADALQADAQRSKGLGIVKDIVPEVKGGYHRFPQATYFALGRTIGSFIKSNEGAAEEKIREGRYDYWRRLGAVEGKDFVIKDESLERTDSLSSKGKFEVFISTLFGNDEFLKVLRSAPEATQTETLQKLLSKAHPRVNGSWVEGLVKRAIGVWDQTGRGSINDLRDALIASFKPQPLSIENRLAQLVDTTADGRIEIVEELDPNLADTTIIDFTAPFRSLFPEVISVFDINGKLEKARKTTGSWTGLFTGYVKIGGITTLLVVKDPQWNSASDTSSLVGEKMTRAFEDALKRNQAGQKIPVIVINTASGARQQDGQRAMDPLNKELAALVRLRDAKVPTVILSAYHSFGGDSASISTYQDASLLLIEEGTRKGFTGAEVVMGTENDRRDGVKLPKLAKLPAPYQTAGFLARHGYVDGIVSRDHERELLKAFVQQQVIGRVDPTTPRAILDELLQLKAKRKARISRIVRRENKPFGGKAVYRPLEATFKKKDAVVKPAVVADVTLYLAKLHISQARLRSNPVTAEDKKFVNDHLDAAVALLEKFESEVDIKALPQFFAEIKDELTRTKGQLSGYEQVSHIEDLLSTVESFDLFADDAPRSRSFRVRAPAEKRVTVSAGASDADEPAAPRTGADPMMSLKARKDVVAAIRKQGGALTRSQVEQIVGTELSTDELDAFLYEVSYGSLGYFSPFNDSAIAELNDFSGVGLPGQAPYTRGIYPSSSPRKGGSLPTVRRYGSEGTAEESNKILQTQRAAGVTGYSIAFDLPTQNGYDSDHPLAKGEVGKVGIAIDTLQDMEDLLANMPIEEMRTSMTINATSPILLAMYVAAAQKRGVSLDKVNGTIQNEVLKEYLARGTFIFPYAGTMRLTTDVFQWAQQNIPQYNTTSISGYHAREKGANEVQEVAYAIANALQYLSEAKRKGLSKNELAAIMGQISWFMNMKMHTFEEGAKIRALRRVWANIVREGFGIKAEDTTDPKLKKLYERAAWVRVQTWSGGSDVRFPQKLTLNIVRNAIRAFNSTTSGAQGWDGAAYDEPIGIPTEFTASLVNDRHHLVQMKGLGEVQDHMAGSYLFEAQTDRIEESVWRELGEITQRGNFAQVLTSMKQNIQTQAAAEQAAIERGDIKVVGMNTHEEGSQFYPEVTRSKSQLKNYDEKQRTRLAEVKASRDIRIVQEKLGALESAARGEENLMPHILEAVKAYATIGEITDRLRRVFGVSNVEPWERKNWVDENGRTWAPQSEGKESTSEVFDSDIRQFIAQRKQSVGDKAETKFNEAAQRGYFLPTDVGYVKKASAQMELPGQFPYTRGISKEVPQNVIDVNGYQIRETGSNAVQELAWSLYLALKVLNSQEGVEAQTQAAQQIRVVLSSHDEFYEEIAKFRVARRLWAKLMAERGITDSDAQQLPLKAVTAASSLTAEKYWLNITRASLQAFQAILGGVQNIEVTRFDIPFGKTERTQEAEQIALDTVHVLQEELGFDGIADPAGGNWELEAATDRMEQEVRAELEKMLELEESHEPAALDVGVWERGLESTPTNVVTTTRNFLAEPRGASSVLLHVITSLQESRRRAFAEITAGLKKKVGFNVYTTGRHPRLHVFSESFHAIAGPGIETTVQNLASSEFAIRLSVADKWFKEAKILAQDIRSSLNINSKASPFADTVGALYEAELVVEAEDFQAIRQAWGRPDTIVGSFVIVTPEGSRLQIVQKTSDLQKLGLNINLASNDTVRALDYIRAQASVEASSKEKRLRVLVAKAGLDGHDRGAETVASMLRDAGFEVIYTGLKNTPESIVETALQEDVDVIGVSILSDAHNTYLPQIDRLMRERGLEDRLFVVGGVIPDEDYDDLYNNAGIAHIYRAGATSTDITTDIRQWVDWKSQSDRIQVTGDNTFDINLPNGKSVSVNLVAPSPEEVVAETALAKREEGALVSPVRTRAMDLSFIPKLDGLWSPVTTQHFAALQHYALAGDLLNETISKHPVLGPLSYPVSSTFPPRIGNVTVASAGIAVTGEHFEGIESVNPTLHHSNVPSDVGVKEGEVYVTMPDGTKRILDILADEAKGPGTITKHIKDRGEGIQQVERWTDDVYGATQTVLAASGDRTNAIIPVSLVPRRGAGGALISFSLVTVERGTRVLTEIVQNPNAYNRPKDLNALMTDEARIEGTDGQVRVITAFVSDVSEGLNANVFSFGEIKYANSASTQKERELRFAERLAVKRAVHAAIQANPEMNARLQEPFPDGDYPMFLKLIEVQNDPKNAGIWKIKLHRPMEQIVGRDFDVSFSFSNDGESIAEAKASFVRKVVEGGSEVTSVPANVAVDASEQLVIKALQSEVEAAKAAGVFSEGELEYARLAQNEAVSLRRLAARLAAKRAVLQTIKSNEALKSSVEFSEEESLDLRLIEITRDAAGRPSVQLLGKFESILGNDLAIDISLTHEKDTNDAMAIASLRGKTKNISFGIDVTTAESFRDIIDQPVVLSSMFLPDEISNAPQEKERQSLYFAILAAVKEAAFKAVGDDTLTWQDIFVSEDGGLATVTVNAEKMPQAPQLTIPMIRISKSNRVQVVVKADRTEQSPPAASTGIFRRATLTRANYAAHVEKNLKGGAMRILSDTEGPVRRLGTLSRRNELISQSIRLLEARGLEVRVIDSTLESLFKSARELAENSSKLDPEIRKHEPGFLALTFGRNEIDRLGLASILNLNANAKGVTLINGALLDLPGAEAEYSEAALELLLESELLNEAGHADSPSVPSDTEGAEVWTGEMHEEASGLAVQVERLLSYDKSLLEDARRVIIDKNQTIKYQGKSTKIATANQTLGLPWIYERYGRVILANGLSPIALDLAIRFKEGDLTSQYDASTGFSDAGLTEILSALQKIDEDFKKKQLPIVDGAASDIRARVSVLKKGLEDPSSVGEVAFAKIELSAEQRLATLPKPSFSETTSKNKIYRAVLAVDASDKTALAAALSSEAEALVVDLNKTGDALRAAQRNLEEVLKAQKDLKQNIILRLSDNEDDWADHLDLISSLQGKESPFKALVIDPSTVLQVRLLDTELSSIERSKGWKLGSIGIFLRSTKQDIDLQAVISSTPRVAGVIVQPVPGDQQGHEKHFELAKNNKLVVLAENGHLSDNYEQEYDGQIVKSVDDVAVVKLALDPSDREGLRGNLDRADALIAQKASTEFFDEEDLRLINRNIEDALWAPLLAVRLGILDLQDKDDLALYEKILKLRQESHYEPGMKREIDLRGANNINEYFDKFSAEHPDQTMTYVSRFEETPDGWKPVSVTVSVASLNSEINKMAAYLYETAGVRKGDRVALIMPNAVQFYVAFRAALKIGAVAVNMEEGLSAKQISDNLIRSDVKAVVYDDFSRKSLDAVAQEFPDTFKAGFKGFVQLDLDDVLPGYPQGRSDLGEIAGIKVSDYRTIINQTADEDPVVKHGIQVGLDDIAFEQFTSGTTGQPKRVGHNHKGWMSVAFSTGQFYRVPAGKKETVLAILPFIHTYGLTSALIVPMITGANTVILPRRDTAEYFSYAARLLLSGEVQQVYSVPTIYQGIMDELRGIEPDNASLKQKLANIRVLVSRGSKLPDSIIDFANDVIGIPPSDGFGSSETPSVATMPLSQYTRGTLGIPGPGAQLRLRGRNAEGEYSMDGPILPLGSEGLLGFSTDASFRELGYIGDDEKTDQTVDRDGYVYPGDIFYVRQDGLIEFRSIKGDMMIIGGRNVSPTTIEEPVEALAGVKRAAAFAKPTDGADDSIMLMVEMNPGAEGTLTEEKIINALKVVLAPHEIPQQVIFGQVPMSANGLKKNRKALREGSTSQVQKRGPADNRVWKTEGTIALMPPAGYHFEGMGKDLYEKYGFVRTLIADASRVLQEIRNDPTLDLAQIMFGDKTDLLDQDFVVSAVALYTYEVANAMVFEHLYGTPAYYAGESMGEPAAIVAAGYLSAEEGVRWTYENALYLHNVSTKLNLRMGVVDGLNEEQLREALKEQDGQVVIRESNTLFIVSMKVDLNEEGESRYGKFIQKMRDINADAKFHESKIATAAHDSRMNPALNPEDGTRYHAYLERLRGKLQAPRARVINTLTGELLPVEDAQAIVDYIEKTKYTTIEWQKTISAASANLGMRHFANLALKGVPFVLNRQKEEGVIASDAVITRAGFLDQFDLANKGLGQNLTANPRRVSSFDPQAGSSLDLRAYAFASGDANSYHLDPAWAARTRYSGVIAHGTFSESVVLSALQSQFAGYELVGSRVELKSPVKPGDTIRPVFVIDQVIGKSAEEIIVSTGALNQGGEIVLQGSARLKKKTVKEGAYNRSSRRVENIAKIVEEVKAASPEEPATFSVGDEGEYYVAVTPDKMRAFEYLFSQENNNPGFAGKDLLLAKAFLSYASFMFVKGYVHIENEVEVFHPISEGDTLSLKTKIVEADDTLVKFTVEAMNQKGETVFKGYVRKLKDTLDLKEEEQFSSDRVQFERQARRSIHLLVNQVIQQIFPTHNRRFAEKGAADNAHSLTFDNEDSSRPETQGIAENIFNSLFGTLRTGTSEKKMAVWRYLINISPKKRKDVVAALNNPEVITAEDFARAIKQDLLGATVEEKMLFDAAKNTFTSYLSINGYPNWEYRKEILNSIDTLDFLDKLVWFRPNSVRNSLNPPMFARNMTNTMAKHGNKLSGIFAPKGDEGEDVETIDRIFTAIELEHGGDRAGWPVGGMLIQSLIETSSAFMNADDIAGSSKRLVALIFGLVDYIAATGGKVQSHQFRYQLAPKRRVIQAAQKEGIFSVDGITPALVATEARRDALRSAMMGFDTKWSIHTEHTVGISAVKDAFKTDEAAAERLVQRVVSHNGAAEFGDKGVFDRTELERHAREETRILQPFKRLSRNREAKYRTPVYLTIAQLLEKEDLSNSGIEAVILKDASDVILNEEAMQRLEELKSKGIKITFALDKTLINESDVSQWVQLYNPNAILIEGDYGSDDVKKLSDILNAQGDRAKNVNIHLAISTREQFKNAYQMSMVESVSGESRVTTLMYNLPETPAEGSNYADVLRYYQGLPEEFYYDWDSVNNKFVKPQARKKDPNNFFLTTPEAPESAEEAARLDQMSELLPYAYAAGVNVVYRPTQEDATESYFQAMDANLMGYHGMVVDADRLQEQSPSILRSFTPERGMIEEALRVIETYYFKGKLKGDGAIPFDFTFGIKDVLDPTKPEISSVTGLVDEATNKIFIAMLERANELGLLSEAEINQFKTYAFERYYAEGLQAGQLVNLNLGEWEYIPGDFTKIRRQNDHTIELKVSEARPPVDLMEETVIGEGIKLLSSNDPILRTNAAEAIYGQGASQSMALGIINIVSDNRPLSQIVKGNYRVGLVVEPQAFDAIAQAANAKPITMPDSVANQTRSMELDFTDQNVDAAIDLVTTGSEEGEISKFLANAANRSGAQKFVHHIKLYTTDINQALALLKQQQADGDKRIFKIANETPVLGAHNEEVVFVLFELGAGRKALLELSQETDRSRERNGQTILPVDPAWMNNISDPQIENKATAQDRAFDEALAAIGTRQFTPSEDLVKTWIYSNDTGMGPFLQGFVPGPVLTNRALSAIGKAFFQYRRVSHTLKFSKPIKQGEQVTFAAPRIVRQDANGIELVVDVTVLREKDNVKAAEITVVLTPKTQAEAEEVRNIVEATRGRAEADSFQLSAWAGQAQALQADVDVFNYQVGDTQSVTKTLSSDAISADVATAGASVWIEDFIANNLVAKAITHLLPKGFIGGTLNVGRLENSLDFNDVLTATAKVVKRSTTSNGKLRYALEIDVINQRGENVIRGSVEMFSQEAIPAPAPVPVVIAAVASTEVKVVRQIDPRQLNRQNPLNLVPVDINKDLRELTGLPGGIPLLMLNSILMESKEQIINNALERIKRFVGQNGADEYVFDLSDPVHPLLKPLAREIVVRIINEIDFKGKLVTVRLNDAGEELDHDLDEVIAKVPQKIDAVFTRAKTAADVTTVADRLKEIARTHDLPENKIMNMILLHAPESYQNAAEIAAASDLNVALVMSHTVAGDLHVSRKLGESLWEKDALRYQRAKALLAAEDNGLLLIDHVITMKLVDENILKDAARKAREAGAVGIRALTPKQAGIFKGVFAEKLMTPREEILKKARATVAEFETAGRTIPQEVEEGDMSVDEINQALGILEDFQKAQLDGEGGMVYDPKGVSEWVDPYSARHFMRALERMQSKGSLDAGQQSRFSAIEDGYGSNWHNQRLLQVSINAVTIKAYRDLKSLSQYTDRLRAKIAALSGREDAEGMSERNRLAKLLATLIERVGGMHDNLISADERVRVVGIEPSIAAAPAATASLNGATDVAVQSPGTKGGIDLNSKMLDLQIKRDGNGIPLPMFQQPMENLHIEGFIPVIINSAPFNPASLPLLGKQEKKEIPSQENYDEKVQILNREEQKEENIPDLSLR